MSVKALKPHISLNVKNVEASVDFYTKLFGIEPMKFIKGNTTTHSIVREQAGEESEKRRHQRELATGLQADRIESEDRSFHERVRQGFLKAAQFEPHKWLVLDASQPPQVLFQILNKKLIQLIN